MRKRNIKKDAWEPYGEEHRSILRAPSRSRYGGSYTIYHSRGSDYYIVLDLNDHIDDVVEIEYSFASDSLQACKYWAENKEMELAKIYKVLA